MCVREDIDSFTLSVSVSPETYTPHKVEKSYFPSGNGLQCVHTTHDHVISVN